MRAHPSAPADIDAGRRAAWPAFALRRVPCLVSSQHSTDAVEIFDTTGSCGALVHTRRRERSE
jgi:hypothetical protein